jgi:N-acetylneuraminic acid mutarotase
LHDTWEWDGEYWIQIADTGPAPRVGHALAFDSVGKRIILFGGGGSIDGNIGAQSVIFGDTWEWKNEHWTQLDDAGPFPRVSHAIATDIKRSRIVLFGGTARGPGGDIFYGDTWEWDGNSWTQREDSGPPGRCFARMSWDPIAGRTLLFGGRAHGTAFSDTWAWEGNQWKQVADIGPSGRQGHAMASDSKRVLLFGGLTLAAARPQDQALPTGGTPPGGFHTTLEKDTWAWDGHRWMQIQDIGPLARSSHAMAYDEKRDSIVLFGGEDQGITRLGDTWESSERANAMPDQ